MSKTYHFITWRSKYTVKKIYLHITFNGKNTILDRFRGHPFDRKLFRLFSGVHVLMDLTHQPKVRYFDPIIMTNQNITGCKITMNEIFLCEVILSKKKNKYWLGIIHVCYKLLVALWNGFRKSAAQEILGWWICGKIITEIIRRNLFSWRIFHVCIKLDLALSNLLSWWHEQHKLAYF